MKRIACVALLVATAACSAAPEAPKEEAASAPAPAPEPAAPAGLQPVWTATEGIATPESVYVDPASGFIFTSQVDGMPGERDGKGHIAKLNADGTVAVANWVDGLNAPKGLRSYQGTLWTADLDEVVGIDIATAKITTRVKIAGAQFLNDVATGADGTVYVSDMMGNKIFAVKGGKATVFAEGEQLEYPNGLLVEGDKLVVGGWGKPEADFSTKVPGRIFTLDLKTKAKTLITPEPFGNTDGLESDGKGGYVVSNYLTGAILRVSATGQSTQIGQFKPGAADIALTPAGVLMVPHMNENAIGAYNIASALQ